MLRWTRWGGCGRRYEATCVCPPALWMYGVFLKCHFSGLRDSLLMAPTPCWSCGFYSSGCFVLLLLLLLFSPEASTMNVCDAADLAGCVWVGFSQEEDFDGKRRRDLIIFYLNTVLSKLWAAWGHGFGVEEAAACGKTRFQVPVRGLLSRTDGGMYKEVVSLFVCVSLCWQLFPCALRATLDVVCVLLCCKPARWGMLSWPVTCVWTVTIQYCRRVDWSVYFTGNRGWLLWIEFFFLLINSGSYRFPILIP